MVGIIIAIIATLVIAVPVSAYVANTRSKKAMEITIGNAEDKAREKQSKQHMRRNVKLLWK